MSDFWVGVVIGFFAAGIFGFILWKFRLWRKEWRAVVKQQKGEVVVNGQLLSKKTPWQVILTGFQAGCLIVMTLLLIGVILWVLLGSPW